MILISFFFQSRRCKYSKYKSDNFSVCKVVNLSQSLQAGSVSDKNFSIIQHYTAKYVVLVQTVVKYDTKQFQLNWHGLYNYLCNCSTARGSAYRLFNVHYHVGHFLFTNKCCFCFTFTLAVTALYPRHRPGLDSS